MAILLTQHRFVNSARYLAYLARFEQNAQKEVIRSETKLYGTKQHISIFHSSALAYQGSNDIYPVLLATCDMMSLTQSNVVGMMFERQSQSVALKKDCIVLFSCKPTCFELFELSNENGMRPPPVQRMAAALDWNSCKLNISGKNGWQLARLVLQQAR